MEDVNEGYWMLRYGTPAWECKNPDCLGTDHNEQTDKAVTFSQSPRQVDG